MTVGKYHLTFRNVLSWLEGNYKYYFQQLENMEEEKREQILYRADLCSKCLEARECKKCFCSLPERFFVDKPQEKRECYFPDFMNKEEWEEYKKKFNIQIKEIEL